VQNVINAITKYKGNVWRYASNPTWVSGGTRPWNTAYIDYFLANSNHYIIIDKNHLYPPSSMTDAQWAQAEADILNIVLKKYGNNPRVIIEIVNECNQPVSQGYHTKIQKIINDIRDAGYSNLILQDNQFQSGSGNWVKYADPMGTYQGQHLYFDQQDLSGAKWQFTGSGQAFSKGIIKFCNTEVGASAKEKDDFNSGNVGLLNQFLAWSKTQGIGNCVWLNHGTENLAKYESLGLSFPN
jgi:hypothetical protein